MDFSGISIFVTGGTGTFGNRVARALHEFGASKVTVFSRDEAKQNAMAAKFPHINFEIGDVRDYERVKSAMRGHDYVFNAAALKVVPSCENHPMEALKTNAIGADNVCRAAIENAVQCCVFLSTDKACYPVNSMGLSKAIMERIAISYAAKNLETRFNVVRYGNVIGSRGSVLELWKNQAVRGEMLRLTHPNMTRFLMRIDDAVALVFEAMQGNTTGTIYIHKAKSATMYDFAHTTAKVLGTNVSFGGIRPGEKIHEILMTVEESLRATSSEKTILISSGASYPMAPNTLFSKVSDAYSSLSAPRFDPHELLCLVTDTLKEMEP